jgi:hypothetical protein
MSTPPPTPSNETDDKSILPLELAHRHHEIVNNLSLLGHGEFLDTLSEARLELETAISETGKGGELNIKIKVMPDGHNKRVIGFEIKMKKPAVATRNTYVFTTQQGQYVENDPEQRQLDLKVVPMGKPQPRAVGH